MHRSPIAHLRTLTLLARRVRAGRAALALGVIAAGTLVAAGPARAGLVTSCTGTAADVTIPGDLFVPEGQSCELTNVHVTGATTVRTDANLILNQSSLAGTLTLQGNAFADLETTTVAGTSQLTGAFGLYSQDSTLTGDVTATGSGFSYGIRTGYQGSVQSTDGETYLQSSRLAKGLATSGDRLTDLTDTVVQGTVTVDSAALGSVVCTSEIDGASTFSGTASGGVVQIGPGSAADGCDFDVFAAGLTLTGNSAPAAVNGSVVRGPLACTDNSPAPTGAGNRLRGGATGQCAGLVTAATAGTTAAATRAGAPDGVSRSAAARRTAGLLMKINARRGAGGRAATAAGRAQLGR